jgi:hypothetical protein
VQVFAQRKQDSILQTFATAPPSTDQDKHASLYEKDIQEDRSIVIVAHSQGNLHDCNH